MSEKKEKWYDTPESVIGIPLNAITGEATNNTEEAAIFYYVKGSENTVFKEEE